MFARSLTAQKKISSRPPPFGTESSIDETLEQGGLRTIGISLLLARNTNDRDSPALPH